MRTGNLSEVLGPDSRMWTLNSGCKPERKCKCETQAGQGPIPISLMGFYLTPGIAATPSTSCVTTTPAHLSVVYSHVRVAHERRGRPGPSISVCGVNRRRTSGWVRQTAKTKITGWFCKCIRVAQIHFLCKQITMGQEYRDMRHDVLT